MKFHSTCLFNKAQLFSCSFSIMCLLLYCVPLQGQNKNKATSNAIYHSGSSINKLACPDIYFENVGDLPGDCISSVPSDISADGKRVVLNSSADDPNIPNDGGTCDPWLGWPHSNQASGWTSPCMDKSFFNHTNITGIVGFGYIASGNAPHAESLARGVSPDGKVVVGYSNFKPDNNIKAVVFTGTGIQELALLDSGCIAADVSQKFLSPPNIFTDVVLKGRIIIGSSNINNQYAIRSPGAKAVYWDNLNHIVELPLPALLPNDSAIISSEAVSISDNGKIIVGNLYYNQKMNPQHYMSYGCVWVYDPQNPWQNRYDLLCVLDDLPGGDNNSKVTGVSGNGRMVIGSGSQFAGDPACWDYYSTASKWEISNPASNPICNAPIALPGLSGYPGSAAFGSSYDGSVIVGSVTNITGACAYPEFTTRPTRWIVASQNQNPEDIGDVMSSFIPSNWTLFDAIRVSADGNTVIGYGMDYDYNIVGWVAGLPPFASTAKVENLSGQDPDFTIVPNPANQTVQLNFHSENITSYLITVTDMLGRVIVTYEDDAALKEINLEAFTPGIYYINCLRNDLQTVKILVVDK